MGLDMFIRKQPLEQEEVAYWRKFYALDTWLVEHIGFDGDHNCVDLPLSEEVLIELRNVCEQIIKEPKKVNELMPGSYHYVDDADAKYIAEDYKELLNKVNELLLETNFDNYRLVYHAWW